MHKCVSRNVESLPKSFVESTVFLQCRNGRDARAFCNAEIVEKRVLLAKLNIFRKSVNRSNICAAVQTVLKSLDFRAVLAEWDTLANLCGAQPTLLPVAE